MYTLLMIQYLYIFDKEEQEKVALVMMTHEFNIKEDFGLVETEEQKPEASNIGEEVDAWLKTK